MPPGWNGLWWVAVHLRFPSCWNLTASDFTVSARRAILIVPVTLQPPIRVLPRGAGLKIAAVMLLLLVEAAFSALIPSQRGGSWMQCFRATTATL
jgi:hypothetical protein